MNFTKGSNSRDLLPPPKMPYEVEEAGFQSPRGLLCARLSYQFLSKSLPLLRGAARAQKQNPEGLREIAVPQRLAC